MVRRGLRPAMMALLAAALLVAACGGDDKKDDKGNDQARASGAATVAATATAAATTTETPRTAAATATASGGQAERVIAADCLKGLSSYRYSGKLKLTLPGDAGGAVGDALGDISFSGAFAAPDRATTKIDLRGQGFETVTIGSDSWTRIGSGPWTRSDAGGLGAGAFAFNPNDFCRDNLANLSDAGVKPTRDRVNGADALKYEFDKQAIGRLSLAGGAGREGLDALPDNTRLTLWVTEKERWPLRVTLTGDSKSASQATFNIEFNITDLNKGDVTIEAPK